MRLIQKPDKRIFFFLLLLSQTDSLACGPQDLNQQLFGRVPAPLTSEASSTAVPPLCYCAVMKASEANESEFLLNWLLAQSAGRPDAAGFYFYIVYSSEFRRSDGASICSFNLHAVT